MKSPRAQSVLAIFSAAALAMGCHSVTAQTSLTYLGTQTIPNGTQVAGFEIGGLSGISYNAYTDTFTAITDDSRAAGASRMWNVRLSYNGTNFSSVTALSSTPLRTSAGADLTFAIDTEGIAGNLNDTFYISHEGLAAGSDPASSIPPWIWQVDAATGNKLAEVALPVKFLPRNGSGQQVPPDAGNQTSGVRSNLSLECLGITPTRKVLFTSNEAALKQDFSGVYDGSSNQAQNSLTRIVRFPGVPGNPSPAEEKVYQADQGTLFWFVRRFNTVPEILPIDDFGRMFVMERGLTQNNTNLGSYRIRIYEVDFNQSNATDVASVNSLIGASYTRLNKTLRWESSSNMDNVEAMCFGRDIDGFRTIVLASDNNFSGAQITQFHVLKTDIPAVTRRTLASSVTGSGTVVATPALAWYPDGSDVSLSAVPGANYSFAGWSGDTTGTSNPLVVVMMNANKSAQAAFLSPFQGWQATYFQPAETAGIGAPSSDPDGDGTPNLLEYALNLHPRQPSPVGLPTLGGDASTLSLTYRKDPSKPDIGWQVEASPDLSTWNPVSDSLIGSDGAIEIRRASVPVEGPSRFLRLKVTKLF